jgi:predicted transcriptional regulator
METRDMLNSLKVKDYMLGDALAFSPDTKILEATHLLVQHHLSGAPVIDTDERVVGFLSEKDCLKAALNASYYEEFGGLVKEVMTREAITIEAESTLTKAAEMFVQQGHRTYPVVEDGRLVGQLSRRDTLKALEKLW